MDTQTGPEGAADSGGDDKPDDRSAPFASDSSRAPESLSTASAPLRFFQTLSVILVLALIGVVAATVYRQHHALPVAVLVDGKPVTTVEDYTKATGLLKTLTASRLGDAYATNGHPEIRETVQLERVAADSTVDTEDAAVHKLDAATHVTVLADAILIDGNVVVALPDRDTAQAALDGVRKHYSDLPPDGAVVDTPTFREHVEIDRRRVGAELCKATADQATNLLVTAPPAKTYVVQFHDRGFYIARKFHMSFTEFLRANSGRNLNRLAPGDTVNVSKSFPSLTVIVRKETSSTEPILPGVAEENAGRRTVTSITTFINGEPQGNATPVNVYTLRRAVPRSSIE